jgi:hypothetical protein
MSNIPNYVVVGTIHHVGEIQQISDTFKKREFIVKVETNNPDYPEFIKMEAQQERVWSLQEVEFGFNVEVHFNLRGKLFDSKQRPGTKDVFNQLVMWSMKVTSKAIKNNDVPELSAPADISSAPDEDELPF